MSLPEVHLIGGTRSEAVKLAPLAAAMRTSGQFMPVLVVGGQHPKLVGHALAVFDLTPDITLTMQTSPVTGMVRQLDALWARRTPSAVIVSGDSTAGLAGALAASWRRIPVVHLEAGLRSSDLDGQFPGEANRRLVAQLTALHLAPTPAAAMDLLDEHIANGDMLISANSMADATVTVAGRRLPYESSELAVQNRPVVTVHRDESLDQILAALRQVIDRLPGPTARAQAEEFARTEDLVDFYAESWISGDRHATRFLLAPDAEIEWNLDLALDEEELVETLNRIALFADSVTVVSKACNDGGAVLVYDCAAPFGTTRMAEFLAVTGDKITGVRQLYDVVALNRYFPGLVDEDR